MPRAFSGIGETDASPSRWVTAAMRRRSTSSTSSWSVHRSRETMRAGLPSLRAGSAARAPTVPSAATATTGSSARASNAVRRTPLSSSVGAEGDLRLALLLGARAADPVRPAEGELDACEGRNGRGLISQDLLIACVEQIFHAREYLHAGLQLVGGCRVHHPVGRHRDIAGRNGKAHDRIVEEGVVALLPVVEHA